MRWVKMRQRNAGGNAVSNTCHTRWDNEINARSGSVYQHW